MLKKYRIINNLSLTDLARLTGISVSYLSQIESGKKFPTIEAFSKIVKVFKVCPYELLDFCADCEVKENCDVCSKCNRGNK